MLYASEAPLRRAGQDPSLIDVRLKVTAEKSAVQHISLIEALRRAEISARIPDVAAPMGPGQEFELFARQLDSEKLVEVYGCGRAADRIQSLLWCRPQVTSFLAGIGLVSIGKFALAMYVGFGVWNDARLAREALMKSYSRSAPEVTVGETEASYRRYTFTSGRAFAEATAKLGAINEVSWADQ